MTLPQDMFELACEVRERAYAPYSNYQVGAVVRATSGRLYAGCNVENAAYPQGWCAETSALAALISAGEKQVIEVVVVGPGGVGAHPCTPCGGCRQKFWEFADAGVSVHVCDPQGVVLTTTIGKLMPNAFGPANLAGQPGQPGQTGQIGDPGSAGDGVE